MDVAIVEGDQPFGKVNVFLNQATPEAALRNIAASAGASADAQPRRRLRSGPLSPARSPAHRTLAASDQTPAPQAIPAQYKPGDLRPHKLFLKYVSPAKF